jgi:hypothetical protein
VNNFKSHFSQKTNDFKKRRHMGLGPDVSTHSATGGKFVPQMWKANNNSVQEYEALKRMESGEKIINSAKAAALKKLHPVSQEGKLGNTGISLLPHPTQQGSFILKK